MAKGKKTGGNDFKPGNKLGKGAPVLSPELKTIRKETRETYAQLMREISQMTPEQWKELIQDKKNTEGLKACMASVFLKCYEKGDFIRLDGMISRVIGKTPDKFQVTGEDGGPLLGMDMTDKQKAAYMAVVIAKAKKMDKI